MASIPQKHTAPELRVRRALRKLGVTGIKLHLRTLPGTPDIVLPQYGIIFQIKGCFWHGHTCSRGRCPQTNAAYWEPKLLKNKKRDKKNERKLRQLGWSVWSLWECRLGHCNNEKELQFYLAKILNRP